MHASSPSVRRQRGLLAAVTTAFFLGGCAAAPVVDGGVNAGSGAAPAAARQPESPRQRLVPTEPPGDLGVVERFAWQRVVELGEAFTAGDAEGFLGKVSRGYYRGYATLEGSLRALFGDSTARAAVVAVRSVASDDGRVSVRARWTSSVTRRDGRVEAGAGETEFLFLRSDTSLRLLDYRGDAPFAIDGR